MMVVVVLRYDKRMNKERYLDAYRRDCESKNCTLNFLETNLERRIAIPLN